MKIAPFGSFLLLLINVSLAAAQSPVPAVTVAWDKTITASKTIFGIQVCPEPPLRRGASIHDPLWAAMRDAKVDMARLQPWFPYPRIGVAELEPPKDGKTSWDFSLIDPIVEDFMNAAEGRPVMLNFSTIPQWMFVTGKPVGYPSDPDEIDNDYGVGNELRDPSMKELVGYYHRFLSWYLKGGFTDEYGMWHASGHHYKLNYWEVLNEVDQEHTLTPAQYTAMYDAIVADLHQLDPSLKFSGPALAFRNTAFIRYFLDPAHHAPGIPLDMYSFHFYSQPKSDESLDVQQHTIFNQADTLMVSVQHMDDIRRQLSPNTKLFINELGSFSNTLVSPASTFPDRYWTLTAGLFAYLYPRLVEKGVDYIGAAELIDYPGQAADTTLVDWNTGRPNARYWAMRLAER